jgi:hypothetical protein
MMNNRSRQARDAAIEYAERELSVAIANKKQFGFCNGRRDEWYSQQVEEKRSNLRFVKEREYNQPTNRGGQPPHNPNR